MPASVRLLRYLYRNFYCNLHKIEDLLIELQQTGNIIHFGDILKGIQTIVDLLKNEQDFIHETVDAIEHALEIDETIAKDVKF